MHYMEANYLAREKTWRRLHKNVGSTQQSSSSTATNHPPRELSKLDEPGMWDTAREVGTSSIVMYACGPLHMAGQWQDDQLEATYSSSV